MYFPYSPFYFDSTILLLLPAILLGIIAQASINNAYRKYSAVYAQSGITATRAAELILRQGNAFDVRIARAQGGGLSDHFDPRAKELRLSAGVYDSSSIAALGIAAHEAGHAIQHEQGYFPLRLRGALVPVVQFGSMASMPILLLGLFMWEKLITIGLLLYLFTVLFQLITLPVELDASRRAIIALEDSGVLTREEIPQAKKVLNAAAMTYVAATLSAILQFLRLLLLFGGRRRRD